MWWTIKKIYKNKENILDLWYGGDVEAIWPVDDDTKLRHYNDLKTYFTFFFFLIKYIILKQLFCGYWLSRSNL